MKGRMFGAAMAAALTATGLTLMRPVSVHARLASQLDVPSELAEKIAALPDRSRAQILKVAIENPRTFRKMIDAAVAQGWGAPSLVHTFGQRTPRRVLAEESRALASPLIRRIGLTSPAAGGVLRRVQSFGYYDPAGQLWVWEWDCGEDRFCANMTIYGNQYGEQFDFGIEWVPTSETTGYVAFDDAYSYHPGTRFGQYEGGVWDIRLQGRARIPQFRRVQAPGHCIQARAGCLANSLNYNWGSGLTWDGAASLLTCASSLARRNFRGYIGCVSTNTGASRVLGFVRHVVENAPQCVGGCM